MSLVVFTGAVGLVVAEGSLHPFLSAVALLCIALGAGAAGCINMWYEQDLDALMVRTRYRPIPTGRIAGTSALEFGTTLAIASVMTMGVAVNWMAAGLLAGAITFYVLVYTVWLKRRTPWNIVIGGAAGAFPPVIGEAAVTGGVSGTSIALFAIIFMWTPPHFWSLALYRSDDYRRAGIPMLPVTAGPRATRWQILAYSVSMIPVSLIPWFIGSAGVFYGVGAAALSVILVLGAVAILVRRNEAAARWMFRYSILYLALLFALLGLDHGTVWS